MKMKKFLMCLCAAFAFSQTTWADVEINETNFPDEAFRTYLSGQSYGKDGILTDAEIAKVKTLNVAKKSIQTLQGVKIFTALTTLTCNGNELTSLDVSGMTSLTKLTCYNNQLTVIDVSGCTALTTLDCYTNQLTGAAVDALINILPTVSNGKFTLLSTSKDESNTWTVAQVKAAKSKGWTVYSGSTAFDAEGVVLNAANFPDDAFRDYLLSQTYGKDSLLSDTDISKVTSLTLNSKQIKTFQGIGYFTELKTLSCNDNELTDLDVSGCTALTSLTCYNNQIVGDAMTALIASLPVVSEGKFYAVSIGSSKEGNTWSIAQNKTVKTKGWTPYYASSSMFNTEGVVLNAANFPDDIFRDYLISQSYGKDSILSDTDISKVTSLSLTSKKIKTFQGIGYFTAMQKLDCYGNELTGLDVSGCKALTALNCYRNQLTFLDVSGCKALTSLSCDNNQLTSLDVSNNTSLTWLSCYNNQIADDAMTALIASLPTTNDGKFYGVSLYGTNEGNTWSIAQNKIAKAKGWSLYYPNTAQAGSGEFDTEGIILNDNNFPDLYFRNHLLNQTFGKDSVISDTEIKNITSLKINFKGINNLQGISYFTALTSLKCNNNNLTALDLSKNTMLQTVSCYNNDINGRNMEEFLYGLPVTEDGKIELFCFGESEKNSWSVAQMIALKEKGWSPFYLYANSDTSTAFDTEGILINTTNFPDENFCNELLKAYGKDSVLSHTEIASINELNVSNKRIKSLKGIEYLTVLNSLDCSYNSLMEIDVSQNTALATLKCNNNQLTGLDVSQNTALTSLDCNSNALTGLDVSQNTALKYLSCYSNKLTELDVTKNTALTSLECYNNQLTGLDVTKNTALTSLECYNNQLTGLDVTKNTELTTLKCNNNQLTGIDVSQNTALRYLYCYNNQLTELDMTKNTELTSLDCNNNQLVSLVFNDNIKLSTLLCHSNQLASLDVSKLINLHDLNCNENNLSILDVSNNTKLSILYCSENNLSTLDVSPLTKLTYLDCSANQILALDVITCTNLSKLNCSRNKINGQGMQTLIAGMRKVPFLYTTYDGELYNNNPGVMYVIDNTEGDEGNSITTDQVAIVKDKYWNVYEAYKYLIGDTYKKSWREYEGSDPYVGISGDVNDDNNVDVEDVVGIVNKILGEPAANFNSVNADVNGDGKIDVDDVVAVVNIILDSGQQNAREMMRILKASGFRFYD